MLNRIRSAWWALVALVLMTGAAHAQQVVDGQQTAPVFTKIGGVSMDGDTTGRVLKFDSSGRPYFVDADRDRDFPLITNLFAGQQLTVAQAYQMNVGVPLMQYTRAAIMLTWAAAAADTDSVRIAVRVYGATSSTSGNWHLWTPQTTYGASDTCAQANLAVAELADTVSGDSVTFGRCLKPVSFWVTRATRRATEFAPLINGALTSLYNGPAVTTSRRVRIRKIPVWAIRYGSANAVMLNLTDQAGAPCPFPYIRIEVFNASGQSPTPSTAGTLTNVEANLWPRVQ